jgi:hypothetical protein
VGFVSFLFLVSSLFLSFCYGFSRLLRISFRGLHVDKLGYTSIRYLFSFPIILYKICYISLSLPFLLSQQHAEDKNNRLPWTRETTRRGLVFFQISLGLIPFLPAFLLGHFSELPVSRFPVHAFFSLFSFVLLLSVSGTAKNLKRRVWCMQRRL